MIILFQRFQAKHWGVMPLFKSEEHETFISIEKRKLILKDSPLVPYTLLGRATTRILVTHDEEDLFVKLSWQEKARPLETTIIETARRIAAEEGMADHLPAVVASQAFEDYSTDHFRTLLGIETKGSRILCGTVFEMQVALTSVPSIVDFWKAYWDIVKCMFITITDFSY